MSSSRAAGFKKNPCVECGRKISKHYTRSDRICSFCSSEKARKTWEKTRQTRIESGLPIRAVHGRSWIYDPLSGFAHRMVAAAVCHRILPQPSTMPCVDCGGQATEYDHRDYNRPLDVQPVCRGCNRRRGSATPIQLPSFALKQVSTP